MLSEIKNISYMAFADFRFEKRIFFYNVVSIAVIVAPILVLFGLKFGIVSALTDRLKSDPQILALHPMGQGRYADHWLEGLRNRTEVGFVVPNTRYLSNEVYLENSDADTIRVELIPTGEGDPVTSVDAPMMQLFGAMSDGVILSKRAAEQLKVVSVGSKLSLSVTRRAHGKRELVELPVHVLSILPLSSFGRSAAFVTPDLLLAVEDYRSLIPVKKYGWGGSRSRTNKRQYASFRLYAKDLESIRPLRDWLIKEGIEVHTRLAQVEAVQAIDRNLSTLFIIIASLSMCGMLLAVGLGSWSSVLRKEHELSLLRLLGFSNLGLALFPMVQALASTFFGVLVALLLYAGIQPFMNSIFSQQIAEGEKVCQLLPEHAIIVTIMALGFSFVAALFASRRAWEVSPSKGLRQE